MQQPELGQRLTALRKEKNLTQEELVEKSNVSVRTIQRIEAGEVLPRMITVKILLEALGETYESFSAKPMLQMEIPKTEAPSNNRNTLLVAAIAGFVYLVFEIILGTMNIAWMMDPDGWATWMNPVYIALQVLMVTAYFLFARGFITLASLFENPLLKVATYMMSIAVLAVAVLDMSTLALSDLEFLWFPYIIAAVLFGSLSIVMGVGLIRLQDGMGEISRIAGVLEIVLGCLLVTVVLFFIAFVVMVPTIVVEILVLYRGYEYLSRPQPVQVKPA